YGGGSPALAYLGFEVASEAELESAQRDLERLGIEVARATPAEGGERAVVDFIHFRGPDDVRIELYRHASVMSTPMIPGRPIDGFVAGPLGLGHVVLVSANPKRAERFYADVLGLRVSDYIHFDGIEIAFMHCNRRHHSIALLNEVEGMRGGELNHV